VPQLAIRRALADVFSVPIEAIALYHVVGGTELQFDLKVLAQPPFRIGYHETEKWALLLRPILNNVLVVHLLALTVSVSVLYPMLVVFL
jgi:hypothetical protein